jgi:4-hydroxythreonine-4-phosphate dehydrogenase
MKPVIAITVGDFNGIGPEVALKSASSPAIRRLCTPLLIGPLDAYRSYARGLQMNLRFEVWNRRRPAPSGSIAVDPALASRSVRVKPGTLSAVAGRIAVQAIERAVDLIRTGEADAMVTAPVSKRALHRAGMDAPGQTELLQRLSGSRRVAMMLVAPRLRVGLVTIHVPVAEISRLLTRELLRERITVIHGALLRDWGIPSPRIAVLGINPHAGEGGDIGREERVIIQPALRQLQHRGMHVEGPFPADAFFARFRQETYDAVVAMYHDQGLIPFKMIARGRGVNYSAGLPIVRTSPDHGTGFDIAGSGKADPRSMKEAIRLAVAIASRRSGENMRRRS